MINLTFTGTAEEVLKDITMLIGGVNNPGERIKNIAASADGLKKLKELKPAIKEAPKKAEKPKKPEAKGPTIAELRTASAKFCHERADGKEVIKTFLKEHGATSVPKLKPEDMPEFLKLIGG